MHCHQDRRFRMTAYLFWIPLTALLAHETTELATNTTEIAQTTNANIHSTTANETASTNVSIKTTILPPWPVEMHTEYSLWTNDCYCGALTVPAGSTVILNGTEPSNETYLAWFLSHTTFSELLCVHWENSNGNDVYRDYLNYNCTREQITLINVSTANTGIYFERRGATREFRNYTFICYNLTVSTNATNATEPPVITTTKCDVPPWKIRKHSPLKTAPTIDVLNLTDIIKSRAHVSHTYVNDYTMKIVLQYSWLATLVSCTLLTLLFALYIPQRLCYLCFHVLPRKRGYKKLSTNDV
ncbi:membrane protein RL11H [Cercopithecine betaherpesvirus 5]|uniref:Membrane protein RL11H n=1 Tax=Simian cytomegalovirus (strain Colburn) TaxID=50292 RepID=G8XTQ9_SCMVC|nr:membrane protein RL11H [Cercopithecine betaherpesvirus 5]